MRYLQQNPHEEKVTLDVKDKKILSLLARNARLPQSAMAKYVGLSREAIAYRIQNYESKGLIQGYRTVIDITLFGYEAYHVFLQLNRPTLDIEKKLIQTFKNYPFIRAIIKFSGKYDLELAIVAKSVREFDTFLDTILSDCSLYLQDYKLVATTESYVARVFPQSFFAYEEKLSVKKKKKEGIVLDEKDKELLMLIANHATLSYQELSKKMKVSSDTVSYRLKKLEDAGIIRSYIPVVNYSALCYNIYAVLFRISGLDIKKRMILKGFLTKHPHFLWAVKCVGRYNLLSYLCVQSNEELTRALTELRLLLPDTIIDYEILIANEEYKYTYFPDYGIL